MIPISGNGDRLFVVPVNLAPPASVFSCDPERLLLKHTDILVSGTNSAELFGKRAVSSYKATVPLLFTSFG